MSDGSLPPPPPPPPNQPLAPPPAPAPQHSPAPPPASYSAAAPPAQGAPGAPSGVGSKKWWFIGGAVVAVAAAVVAVLVLGGGDDKPGPPARVDEAAATVRQIIDDTDLGDDGTETIDCPVDMDAVVAASSIPAFETTQNDGDPYFVVYEAGASGRATIECSYVTEAGFFGVGLQRSVAVDEYEDFLLEAFDRYEVELGERGALRGATTFSYCATPTDDADGLNAFCEIDWVSDELVYSVFTSRTDVTEAELSAWLSASLPGVVTDLADN